MPRCKAVFLQDHLTWASGTGDNQESNHISALPNTASEEIAARKNSLALIFMANEHDHAEEVLEFSAKRPAKLKTLDADALILVDGVEDGSFAVASSKKELK